MLKPQRFPCGKTTHKLYLHFCRSAESALKTCYFVGSDKKRNEPRTASGAFHVEFHQLFQAGSQPVCYCGNIIFHFFKEIIQKHNITKLMKPCDLLIVHQLLGSQLP